MPSHYSSLGFWVETEEEFDRLYDQCFRLGREVSTEQGLYIVWEADEGIELTMPVDENGEVVDCHPHFVGRGRMRVGIVEALKTDEHPLEMTLNWVEPDDPENPEATGLYPFLFELPEYTSFRRFQYLPQPAVVQVAAFAYELSCYSDEREFEKCQETELKLASQAFIPDGIFADSEEQMRATAFFTGKVLDARFRMNRVTGYPFWHLLVETYGSTVDVVADPDAVNGTIGGIVKGMFWLSGKIMCD